MLCTYAVGIFENKLDSSNISISEYISINHNGEKYWKNANFLICKKAFHHTLDHWFSLICKINGTRTYIEKHNSRTRQTIQQSVTQDKLPSPLVQQTKQNKVSDIFVNLFCFHFKPGNVLLCAKRNADIMFTRKLI